MATDTTQNLLFTEHKVWLSQLEGTKQQFAELQQRLQTGLKGLNHSTMLAKAESFQNRFIRQKEVIDELRHEIKQHENHLESLDQPTHLLLLTHVNLRDQYQRFYELFIELERDFDEFLA
jgi:hypothetical protein